MVRVGIIGAMEIEVEQLKADMTIFRKMTKAGMDFYEGELSGAQAVVVKCGIGKVNAAVCTQILADEFQVSCVLNTGVAGSLDAEIAIGDIVISRDVLHHDMDVEALGYPAGQVPQLKPFSFEADPALAELAGQICRKVNPGIGVFYGRIVSGDQFIAGEEQKARIKNRFGGYCAEMEGAAVAQSAYLNQIPFLIVRAISDQADNSASVDYPTFEKEAAQHCVRLVEGMLPEVAAGF